MSTRAEKTEICYRTAMRKALIDLLLVMNPSDQLTFGAMTYSEMVVYARDWLDSEVEEISTDAAIEISQKFKGEVKSPPRKLKDLIGAEEEPTGLSLD